MLWALWLHVPTTLLVGMAAGQGLWLVVLAVGLLGLGASAASSPVFSRRVRTLLGVVTLLSFSAWLVHVTGGRAESHLHFFAVVAVVLLYQECVPVVAAGAYVAVHYGVFGMLFPAEVYSSEAARDRPIVWAFIYAGFVIIAGLTCLAAWRLAGAERAVVGRMLDAVGAGIYGVDAAGRITFVNSVLCTMVGKNRESLEGADHHLALGHQLPAGGPAGAADCGLCSAVSRAEEVTGETYLGGAGAAGAVPVEYVTRPAGSGSGDLGSVITVRDLRERHAWKALRRQAEAERDQLASIAEASPDLALIGRSDGQLVWMNAAGRKLLGFDRSENIAEYRIEDLFSPAEMARIYAEDMPVLGREGSWQGEWTLQTRDGTQVPVLVTQHVHHDGAGGDTYVSGTMRDLRPQRAEERRLRESEQRLSAAERVAGMGSWEWDPVSDKVRSSPGLVHLLGLAPGSDEEGINSWLSLIHPDDLQMALDRTEEARSVGTPVDVIYRMVRADGRQLSVQCRGEMVAHEQGPGMSMLGTVLDVTDRHAASEALRESEELARSVIATAGDAYIQFGGDGLVTEWNGKAEATFGLARSKAVGRPFSSLVLAAGSRELFERRVGLRYGFSDEPADGRFEMSMLHSSGREIPVEVTAWTIQTSDAAVFNCFIRDISERQAVQRAKDEFLSVVGHELRTPLTSIHGALGLLRAGLLGELNDRGKQMVGIAAHNTDRLVRLINDILDIERLNSGTVLLEHQECDIAKLGKRSVEAMRPMAEAAGVRLEIKAQPGILQADPDRIEQTLTNLLSNAIKFSPAGATVRLTTRLEGDEVQVQVQDQGRGIPPGHLELIFDRFQQVDGSDAREKGGTGLGLAICRTIVQQHGGRIWAESGSGRGATLTLRLPVIPPHQDPATGGGPTVLICGNDASNRGTIAAILAPHGFTTIDVPSAAGLLAAVTTHRPALILLEPRTPVMDGWHTALDLLDRTEMRDVPVVFLSLHGDKEATVQPGPVAGSDNPIGRDGLFAAVEKAISSRAAGPTLLLVEDDEGFAQILTERFRHLGIEVHHAPTAQRALALCAHLVPDLLVLDLLLPDQDGYAVVAQLRRDARLRGMPLAVYTACDLSDADRQRLRLGQTEFFTKGRISPDEFERHVVDLLGHLTKTEGETTNA